MNMQVDKLFVKMHTWVTFEKVFYAAELSLGFYMFKKPSKSEVIGRCGGNEKTEWSRRTDKSRTLKFKKKSSTKCDVTKAVHATLPLPYSISSSFIKYRSSHCFLFYSLS